MIGITANYADLPPANPSTELFVFIPEGENTRTIWVELDNNSKSEASKNKVLLELLAFDKANKLNVDQFKFMRRTIMEFYKGV